MKVSMMRSFAVLAVILGVAGCGSKAKFDVGGPVIGLQHPGLKLINAGETLEVPAGATTFKFTKQIEYGEMYNVTLGNQPAHQTCSVPNPSDTAGRLIAIDVAVVCELNIKPVTVTLEKPAPGLQLTNGSAGPIELGATATTVQFPVEYGKSYGITILKQPTAGNVCTVLNGSGTMGDDEIKDVSVKCT